MPAAPPSTSARHQLRQVRRIGGRAELVVHDAERRRIARFAAGAGQAEDRGHEVAPGAEDPAGPQDERIGQRGAHPPFPLQLAAAVLRGRGWRILLGIGPLPLAIEDVVRRHVDESHAAGRAFLRQDARGLGIDAPRLGGLALAAVDPREGSRVGHDLGPGSVQRGPHSRAIRDVEPAMVEGRRQNLVAPRREASLQALAELSAGSRDQPAHGRPRITRSRRCTQTGSLSCVLSRVARRSASSRDSRGPTRTRQRESRSPVAGCT